MALEYLKYRAAIVVEPGSHVHMPLTETLSLECRSG